MLPVVYRMITLRYYHRDAQAFPDGWDLAILHGNVFKETNSLSIKLRSGSRVY